MNDEFDMEKKLLKDRKWKQKKPDRWTKDCDEDPRCKIRKCARENCEDVPLLSALSIESELDSPGNDRALSKE